VILFGLNYFGGFIFMVVVLIWFEFNLVCICWSYFCLVAIGVM
jgi:hypothetical protein